MYDIMENIEVIKALRISNINVDDVVFGQKKTTKTIPIQYKNNSFVFQTPFMEVHGGLRKTGFQNIYQLDTLFKGDTSNKMDQLFHFIENLEDRVVKLLSNNGTMWFQHQEVVIKSLIRELDATKENYFIKWPIDLKNNIFIGENKQPFDPFELKNKDRVKLIVGIFDLWINNNQCGLAVIVQKILVKKYEEKIPSEYVFDDSENEEDENENSIISLLATEQKTRPRTKVNLSTNTSLNAHPTENVITKTHSKHSKVNETDYENKQKINKKSKNTETQQSKMSEHRKTPKHSPVQKKSKKILDEFDLSIEDLSENYDSEENHDAEINEYDLDFE